MSLLFIFIKEDCPACHNFITNILDKINLLFTNNKIKNKVYICTREISEELGLKLFVGFYPCLAIFQEKYIQKYDEKNYSDLKNIKPFASEIKEIDINNIKTYRIVHNLETATKLFNIEEIKKFLIDNDLLPKQKILKSFHYFKKI